MQYSNTQNLTPEAPSSNAGPFPCLNSNICTDPQNTGPARLSTSHRKTAFILTKAVQQLADRYGIERLGFLTLTFSEHITSPKEAQKRKHSLITHVIGPRYQDYICVFERQKSGRIHYHLVVVLNVDIRRGANFQEFAQGNYKSASAVLRAEWAFWRKTAPRYRFGRTELLPIKSTAEAIGKYVGKYIAKHIEARKIEDKGVRLVSFSSGSKAGTTRFQFLSPGSYAWRRKVSIFAQIIQEQHPEHRVSEIADISKILGKRWAYNHREYILSLP